MSQKTKTCTKCRQEYPATSEYFHKRKNAKDGLRYWCRKCRTKDLKKWRRENPLKYMTQGKKNYEKNRERMKQEYEENRDKYIKRAKKYYEANKDKKYKKHRIWVENNKEKVKEYHRKYMKDRLRTESQFRLNSYFSSRIRTSLKRKGSSKNGYSWEEIVGYTIKDLMEHLGKQFTEGMTWDNYGKWHVDHIKPQSSFKFTSYKDKEFQECWKLSNLQPLWAVDNLRKGNKIIRIKI